MRADSWYHGFFHLVAPHSNTALPALGGIYLTHIFHFQFFSAGRAQVGAERAVEELLEHLEADAR